MALPLIGLSQKILQACPYNQGNRDSALPDGHLVDF